MLRFCSLLLSAGALLAAQSPSTAASCPSPQELSRGFVLHAQNGRTQMRVTPLTPRDHLVETLTDGRRVTSMVYRDGLFPVSSAHARGFTTYEYKSDIGSFSPRVGEQITYTAIVKTPGQQDTVTTAEIRITGEENIKIGDFSYSSLVIERTNISSGNNVQSNTVVDYYNVDMKMPIQSMLLFADGQRRDFIVSRVELIP